MMRYVRLWFFMLIGLGFVAMLTGEPFDVKAAVWTGHAVFFCWATEP